MFYRPSDCEELAADVVELKRKLTALQEERDQLRAQLDKAKQIVANRQGDQSAAYRQLIELERVLAFDEIARGIEHELYNALTPIEGYTELLLAKPERLADLAQAIAYLSAIQDAAQDAKQTIGRLREFYYSTGNVDVEAHGQASKLLAAALRQEAITQPAESAPDPVGTKALSPREWDVLRLLADGMKNKEIAATLFVTENTVKTHIRGILTKLSLKNRTQAAAFALLDSRAF